MKVSIITPSYNQGQFIERTICSVLSQTYKNIEYILIDGGSTDNTMEVVEKYKDRINIIIHEKDKGQADAINKGFRLATGTLVGWINSDDVLYPACVEKMVYLANLHPEGSIYYPAIIDLINGKDEKIGQVKKCIRDKATLVQQDYCLIQQGSFYSLQLVKAVNFLDDGKYYCMDLDLWLKLLDKGKIYYYDHTPQAAFRIWEDSKTSTGGLGFFKDIKQTLQLHRMRNFSPNSLRLNWYMFKAVVKRILLRNSSSVPFIK